MNYLKQLLAFYDELELNPLSSSEIALWHALMSINNKTAWSDTFTVASSVLCQRSGLGTPNFFKTRNNLAQKGYIKWGSSGGNRAAKYQIKVLYKSASTDSVDVSIDNSSGNTEVLDKQKSKTKVETQVETQAETNNNQDENAYRDLITEFQQNFGINSTKPLMLDDLKYTIADFVDQGNSYTEAIEIVQYALKIAVAHQASSWSYVKGIIKNWVSKSLFNIESIKEYQEKPRRQGDGKQKIKPDPQYGKLF